MIQMAEVDVLIPTFNRPDRLRLAVDSILKQTFQDFRIIIWDDASEGPPPDLPEDPRIEYHRSPVNLGVASSRNSLFDLVQSPYACFLDDDDTAHPERLEKQLTHLKASGCDIALCWIRWVNPQGQTIQYGKSKGRTRPECFRWSPQDGFISGGGGGMNFATAFFKKEITKYRFQQDPQTLGEARLWYGQLLQNGVRFTVVRGFYYVCMIHPGNNSWKKPSTDPAVQTSKPIG